MLPERPEPPADPPEARPPDDERAWHAWTAPIALVAAIVLALVGGLIVLIFAGITGAEVDAADPPPGVALPSAVVQQAAFIASAIIFAGLATPPRPEHFGLRPPRTTVGKAIGLIFLVFVGYLVFAGVWSTLVDLGGSAEEQLDGLGVDNNDLAIAFGAIVVCVGAPIAEEFFFRGFFYAALRNRWGPLLAALFTGGLFGVIHFTSADAAALVPLAVLGIGFCFLYEATGSLYPCIALHAINNSLAFGIAVDWEWQIPLLLFGSLLTCGAVAAGVTRRWRPAASHVS